MATGPSIQTGKPATARPSRSRSATKATPAAVKPAATTKAPEAAAEAPVETPTPVVAKEALKLILDHTGTTKRYEVFEPDAEAQAAGVVGKLYFPLGTKVVKVLATE